MVKPASLDGIVSAVGKAGTPEREVSYVNTHILIVDDASHAKPLSTLLRDVGYQVSTLADPRGIEPFLCDRTVDLVLLGVARPSFDGIAVCTELRRDHPHTPMILLGERRTTAELVRGFEGGADDFIAEPYETAELRVRMVAVLRCHRRVARAGASALLRVGKMSLDLGRLSFTASSGHAAMITPTEMRLLECLMRNANAVIPRERLIHETWGYESETASNRVDVYIRRLRQKIEANPKDRDLIRTVRGVGYVFEEDTTKREQAG